MLLPTGNPIKCHEEVLSLQPSYPTYTFWHVFPLPGGCSKGLDEFRFSIQQRQQQQQQQNTNPLLDLNIAVDQGGVGSWSMPEEIGLRGRNNQVLVYSS